MKSLVERVVLAFGLSTLYATWLLGPLIDPNHLAVYHWAGNASGLFLPPTLDFLVVCLALTVFLLSFQIGRRWHGVGWAFLLCFSAWFTLKDAVLLRANFPSRVLGWFLLLAGSIGLLCYVLQRKFRESPRYLDALKLFQTLLRFAAAAGVLILVQVAWFAWKARSLNRDLPTHFLASAPVAHAQKPRIFWIVLDELSFQQTYGHRFSGLQLPAFDRLAATSTIFTQVIAAGSQTEKVLPALVTGEPVDAVRSSALGTLETHNPDAGAWSSFQGENTIFHDAAGYGYQTALAGWYNPYCRLLAAVLHQCTWTMGEIDNTMEYRNDVVHNMVEPLRYELSISRLHHSLKRIFPIRDRWILGSDAHVADFQDLDHAANTLLRATEDDFVFLHMPIPHPEGIYHRSIGELATEKSSYLDNLALADRFLDRCEALLREQGEWDSSTVVIMGDHGWRTRLSPDEPGWSDEGDQAMQTEARNRRPAMIVKLPGQSQGARLDEPFRALQTRKLMNALFGHQIRTSDDLHDWVRRNP